MKKPCLIFDVDGTLADTYELDGDYFFESIRNYLDITDIDTEWANYPHVTDSGIVKHLFEVHRGKLPEREDYLNLERNFSEKFKEAVSKQENISAVKGAVEFVKWASEKNFPIGVATGGWRSSASYKLENIGLDFLVSKMISANEGITREGILLASIEKAGSSIENTWYFGDGSWDVKCTSNLGIKFIGIGPKLKNSGLKHWVEDFSEAERLFEIVLS